MSLLLNVWPTWNRSTEDLIYQNWERTGLLESLDIDLARKCSLVLDEAAKYLLQADFEMHKRLDIFIFPCIRRIFKYKQKIDVRSIVFNLNAFLITNHKNLQGEFRRNRYGKMLDIEAGIAVYFCEEHMLNTKGVLLDFSDYVNFDSIIEY